MNLSGRVACLLWLPATALCVLVAACAPTAPPTPDGDPLVIGPVESIEHHGTATAILVRAAAGSREPCGIQARADARTRIFTRSRSGALEPARLAEVAAGDTVEVYVDGPVAESCPVQGRAGAIVRRAGGDP